jgi:hypothetical protein
MAMDKNGNGTSTLPDTLGTIPGALTRLGASPSVESRGQVARKEIPALFQEGAEAEAKSKMDAFDRDQGVIRKTADAERDVARGTRMAGKELETGLQKRGVFEAPQYKASDYAKNSATRMITAVLLGGIARTSAMGQLKAIESMQKAEQQGLADQFDAARLQFDEQEKQRQDNNKMLKDRFDRMIDLLSKDRNAALVEAKLIEGNLGKGIIAAELRAGNYSKAYDLFQKAIEAADKIALEKSKPTAKGARVDAQGRRVAPDYNPNLRIHPSGVPLAPMDPFQGIDDPKTYDVTYKSKLDSGAKYVQGLRAESDKNVKFISSMNSAEEALKRMTQKAFNNAQKAGKIPKEAVLNFDNMSVSGAGMPEVTGGVYGIPGFGEFLARIKAANDPDFALFNAESKNYQRGQYVPGEGQISNFERQLFAQAAIALGQPTAANLQLLRATRESDKRLQQKMNFFEEYLTVNGHIDGAEGLWRRYSEDNPFVSLDQNRNYVFNPNTMDYRTYFRSMQGMPIDQPRQAQPSQGAKTVTMDDIRATAATRNMSVNEVLERARREGFTIED